MTIALYVAASLATALGLFHSILGERYILVRLFRREDLPKLFGGSEFTIRTLRFAWHLTTIAVWGFAALLILLARGSASAANVAAAIGVTFVACGLLTLVLSKARHLAWVVLLAIGCVALIAGATQP